MKLNQMRTLFDVKNYIYHILLIFLTLHIPLHSQQKKSEELFSIDVDQQKSVIIQDVSKARTLLDQNKLQDSRSIIGLLDHKLSKIRANLDPSDSKNLENNINNLKNMMSSKVDSLVNRNLEILRNAGIDPAVQFLQYDMRIHGVPEDKLAIVDKAIMDEVPRLKRAQEKNMIERTLIALKNDLPIDPSIDAYILSTARRMHKLKKDSIAAIENARLQKEQMEKARQEKILREQEERKQKEEAKRLAKEQKEARKKKLEEEKIASEKAEKERKEQERLAKIEQAERQRLEKIRADSLKAIRDEEERVARIEKEKEMKNRLENERQKAEQSRLEKNRQDSINALREAEERRITEQNRMRDKENLEREKQARLQKEKNERDEKLRREQEERAARELKEQEDQKRLAMEREKQELARIEKNRKDSLENVQRENALRVQREREQEYAKKRESIEQELQRNKQEQERQKELQKKEERIKKEKEREELALQEKRNREKLQESKLANSQNEQSSTSLPAADTDYPTGEQSRKSKSNAYMQKISNNEQQAQDYIVRIYSLLEQNPQAATEDFKRYRDFIAQYVGSEVFLVLEQSVMQSIVDQENMQTQDSDSPNNSDTRSESEKLISRIESYINQNKIETANAEFNRLKKKLKVYLTKNEYNNLEQKVKNAYKYYKQINKG